MLQFFLRIEQTNFSMNTNAVRLDDKIMLAAQVVLEQAADGILITDAIGNIQYANPAFTLLTGYGSQEVLGKKPNILKSGRHPSGFYELFARQTQGEIVDSEYRIRTPEGIEKWIRDRAFPIRDLGGRLIRVVGIAEEITERKRYEEELIFAREAADIANRAKSDFMANSAPRSTSERENGVAPLSSGRRMDGPAFA